MSDQATGARTAARRSPAQRFEWLVLFLAIGGLALTGLPQKFADQGWAITAIDLLGGIESARIIHRVLALLLLAETVYHVLALFYRRAVLGLRQARLPGLRDVRLAVQGLFANLGLARRAAGQSRTQVARRTEYLVLAVSVVILGVTGLVLWNPVLVARVLPGEAIPTAQSIHSDHALLLVAFLAIWRLAMALLWRERRPAQAQVQVQVQVQAASRRGPFLIIAGVVALLAVIGLVWLLNAERTAINTVPKRVAAIYMPQVHPEAGDAQVGAALWATLRCAFCHGPNADGGANGQPALRNSPRLTFESFYQRVRVGTEAMPAFSPEELPNGYLIHLWAWLTAS
ncbi:MAG: cytochrome c [Anaerolineae bacterium]|nr:cytochrome c [Anaerolineae bacterium]